MTQQDLDRLVSLWLDRLEAGNEISPSELCMEKGCPELTNKLSEEVRFLKQMESGATPSQAGQLTNLLANVAANPGSELPADVVTTPPGSSRFAPGVTFGPYRIESKLGQGGMGEVYRAVHVRLNKVMALKLLPAEFTRRPDVLNRFEREMRAVGALNHPHIVQAHDAGEVSGIHYLAMEYVEGTDLQAHVQQHGVLPVPQVCNVIGQASLALAAAHEAGLIHRDIKPSNLLLSKAGKIKLLDLGLARLADDAPSTTELTTQGQTFGTPDYMAPEQWDDAHAADARTDLYALGCTLYFLLVGHPPYGTQDLRTVTSKMKAHASGAVPSLHDRRGDVPPELEVIYQRLLAKQPADRIQTARELATALAPFVTGGMQPINSPRLTKPATPIATPIATAAPLVHPLVTLPSIESKSDADTRMSVPATAPSNVKITLQIAKDSKADQSSRRSTGGTLYRNVAISVVVGLLALIGWWQPWVNQPVVTRDSKSANTNKQVKPSRPAPTLASKSVSKPASKPVLRRTETVEQRSQRLTAWLARTEKNATPPVAPHAMVTRPQKLPGAKSWTITTVGQNGMFGPHSTSLAISPDETLLASVCYDGTLRIHRTEDGAFVRAFVGDFQHLNSVSWSADGQWLATAAEDGVCVWEYATGRHTIPKLQSVSDCRVVRWSPREPVLAIAGKGVEFWRPDDNAPPNVLPSTQVHMALDWSPDGQMIGYAGENKQVTLWNLTESRVVREMQPLTAAILELVWSPDGKYILTGSDDLQTRLWDVGQVSSVRDYGPRSFNLGGLAWNPDSRTAWTGRSPENALEYNCLAPLSVQGDYLSNWLFLGSQVQAISAAVSRQGKFVAGASISNRIAIFEKPQSEGRFLHPPKGGQVLGWLPDSSGVAVAIKSDQSDWGPSGLMRWSLSHGNIDDAGPQMLVTGQNSRMNSDGSALATGTNGIAFVATGDRLLLQHSMPGVYRLSFSPDDHRLACVSPEKLEVVDIPSSKTVWSQPVESSDPFSAVDWSCEGVVATGTVRGVVRLWNGENGQSVGKLDINQPSDVTFLRFSPDGRILACGFGGRVILCDGKTGIASKNAFLGAYAFDAAWTADNSRLYVVNGHYDLAFLDVNAKLLTPVPVPNWQPRSRFHGAHSLSHDGEFLSVMGRDYGSNTLWHLPTATFLGQLVPLRKGKMMFVSPDGHYRQSGPALAEFVYVVNLEDGSQVSMTPNEFVKRFSWRNDPDLTWPLR